MHRLLTDRPGARELLLGNEGIVRGALEAGIEVATAYPGTPSSEIADTFNELSEESSLYFEYSANEKVALEVAAGAAIAGMRSMCTMKHVGLNVAADPLNTLSYTGVKAGMVIVTADDPSMHSSQNEQDNRFYAKLSLLPMLEPSNPKEAMELTKVAFELSEEVGLPVLLRTTTRVNHTRGVCTFGALTSRRFIGHFDKNPTRWVPVPGVARNLRKVLLGKQPLVRAAMTRRGIDRIEGEGDLGIVASGVAHAYVSELVRELGLLDRVRILKIEAIHPLPEDLISEMLSGVKRLLVVEELEAYVETEVRALAQRAGLEVEILGKGEDLIPRMYELNPDRIRPAVARLAGIEVAAAAPAEIPALPARPPLLCAGCTHRTTYYAVKSFADPDTYFSSDIGCYTLGLAPPLSVADSFLCMGSSVTMASGVTIRNPQKHVAFIGDSTFFHSGITGLANAVHNGHDLMLVILDNSTTAMTGHQPHPGQGSRDGKTSALDMEALVRSLGVHDVQVVDPEDLKEAIATLEAAYHRKGVRVVISKHPCPLYASRLMKEPREPVVYRVDQDRCKFCGQSRSHEACGVPILKDEEILRARNKILSSDLRPHEFPARGTARKTPSAPCVMKCPANVCVFGYLSAARAGRYEEALSIIREQVPLPVSLGRVCHHPCETVCARSQYDEPVAINQVKRFLAERETEEERARYLDGVREIVARERERLGERKIAVIGAGPAGLTAAHDLALRGFAVTVFEREKVPGGLLATGIPAYRMPRKLLSREIDGVVEATGMEIRLGVELGKDVTVGGLLEGGYEAVCLAVGAQRGRRLAVDGEDAEGVEGALGFLRRVNLLGERAIGRRVAVIGGGDAAIDAARTAARLGAEKVTILYRRSTEEMPASAEEVAAAVAEGINIRTQVVPTRIGADGGRVASLTCATTRLGEPGADGRRRPIVVEGSDFELGVDSVLVAVGQETEPEPLDGQDGLDRMDAGFVVTEPGTGATSHPRVFAAGDVTGDAWSVIEAMAQGKEMAAGVARNLLGDEVPLFRRHTVEETADEGLHRPPDIDREIRARAMERKPSSCVKDFDEVSTGFDEEKVLHEAERCLGCGQCGRCNNCIDNFGCPAIYKVDGKVMIDDMLCIGCGVCAQICPNDAIVPVRLDQIAR